MEIKNAQLGEGSKANHLSYLGDATIGRNVNIGAGTIICNYDSANKHQTVIRTKLSSAPTPSWWRRSRWARCDDRCGQHDRPERACRRADRLPREADHGQRLEEANETSKVRGQLTVDRFLACVAGDNVHALSFAATDNRELIAHVRHRCSHLPP